MFALVRFIDDIGNETRRYVVRVEDIEDFCPAHEADFDAKGVYFVHWTDEVDSANTGDYRAQILRLGGSQKKSVQPRCRKKTVICKDIKKSGGSGTTKDLCRNTKKAEYVI
ncbi:hypothetical protein MTO96_036513 [Rhipicephalus appendiculatus]